MTLTGEPVNETEKTLIIHLSTIEKYDPTLTAPKKMHKKKGVRIAKPQPRIEQTPEVVKQTNKAVLVIKTTIPHPLPTQAPHILEANAAILDSTLRASYENVLVNWLERQKRYPRRAQKRGSAGEVLLTFKINRTGKVLTARIEQSSGYHELDAEVEKMIERANPFPSIPDTFKNDHFELTVPIEFLLAS